MELNSDEKYYQKYIQYKHQYIMLKQLKNNNNYNYNYNELEGGDSSWWQSIFGKSEATLAKERAAKELKERREEDRSEAEQNARDKAAEEEAYAATFSGDGTYLVFEVINFNNSNYPNLKHLNYDNEKRKTENSKDGTDIVIMDKVEFSTHFKHAYIVIKDKEIYTYKYIVNDNDFESIYRSILEEVQNIKNDNCKCNITPVNDNNNNNVSTLTTRINDHITIYNSSNAMHQKSLYESLISNIDNQINTGDHQKFVTHTLNYKEPRFDATTNDSFLIKMKTDAVPKTIKESVDLNMIIKIKNNYKEDTNYIFDKIITKEDASYTTTYAKINKFIAEYDLNAKGGVTDQIERAQESGKYPIATTVPNPVQYGQSQAQYSSPAYQYPLKYGADARQQGQPY